MFLQNIGVGSTRSLKSSTILQTLLASGFLGPDVANLIDTTDMSTTGGASIVDGVGTFDGSAISRLTLSNQTFPAGDWWVHTIVEDFVTSATYRVRALSPTYTPEGLRLRGHHQIWRLPDLESSTALDFLVSAGYDNDLRYMQAVDMSDTLDKPQDIWVLAGQSNMACSTSATELSVDKDGWEDKRLLAQSGATYDPLGAVQDEITAAKAPLVMNSISGGAYVSQPANSGLSPGLPFAQELLSSVSENKNLLLVNAAISSTSLEGADAAWNPSGSTGDGALAYDAMVARVNAALAAAPDGSELKGVLWAQGEGDTSADMSSYPASFATMRTAAETAWGRGPLPWIILLPPEDASRSNQDEFVRVQTAMDAASGGPEAQPLCFTVPRPTGFMEDTTHVTAAGQRIAGKSAALVAKEKILDVLPYTQLFADPNFNVPAEWSGSGNNIPVVSGGVATFNSTGNGDVLADGDVLEVGETFIVRFKLSSYTSGNMRVRFGDASSQVNFSNLSVGEFTTPPTVAAVSTSLSFISWGSTVLEISEASIWKVS